MKKTLCILLGTILLGTIGSTWPSTEMPDIESLFQGLNSLECEMNTFFSSPGLATDYHEQIAYFTNKIKCFTKHVKEVVDPIDPTIYSCAINYLSRTVQLPEQEKTAQSTPEPTPNASKNYQIRRGAIILTVLLCVSTCTVLFVKLFKHIRKLEHRAEQSAEQIMTQEQIVRQCGLLEITQEKQAQNIGQLQKTVETQQEKLAQCTLALEKNTTAMENQRQIYIAQMQRAEKHINTATAQFNRYLGQMGSYAAEIENEETLFKRSTSWIGSILPAFSLDGLGRVIDIAGRVATAGSTVSGLAHSAQTLMPTSGPSIPQTEDLERRIRALKG